MDKEEVADDLWLRVFSYLGTADRLRIERVCRQWKELARASWKRSGSLLFNDDITNNPIACSPLFPQLTDDHLEDFLRQCGKHLLCLDLTSHSNHRLTSQTLNLIAKYCFALQELHLRGMSFKETALVKLVGRFPRLTSLSLIDCVYDEEELQLTLKRLHSLRSLNIADCDAVTGRFFSQAPLSLTKVIATSCWDLTDKSVCLLARRCPNLETLDISDCRKLTGQSIAVLVEECPRLKSFKINKLFDTCMPSVATQYLLYLSKLTHLKELHMDRNENVTDQLFLELGRHCHNLQTVSCESCHQLTDTAVFRLSHCSHLESINLSQCQAITDKALVQLTSAHPKLKKVYLEGCSGITDAGVGHLVSNRPNIQYLDVSHCDQVTDRVLSILKASLRQRQHSQPLNICVGYDFYEEIKASEFLRENESLPLLVFST